MRFKHIGKTRTKDLVPLALRLGFLVPSARVVVGFGQVTLRTIETSPYIHTMSLRPPPGVAISTFCLGHFLAPYPFIVGLVCPANSGDLAHRVLPLDDKQVDIRLVCR